MFINRTNSYLLNIIHLLAKYGQCTCCSCENYNAILLSSNLTSIHTASKIVTDRIPKSFYNKVQTDLSSFNISLLKYFSFIFRPLQYLIVKLPNIIWQTYDKNLILQNLRTILAEYSDYRDIYTDASKYDGVEAAVL